MDVANTVVLAASDKASYIYGLTMQVDGGEPFTRNNREKILGQ